MGQRKGATTGEKGAFRGTSGRCLGELLSAVGGKAQEDNRGPNWEVTQEGTVL